MVDEASRNNKLMDSAFHERISRVCENSSISFIILDNNFNIVLSVSPFEKGIIEQLTNRMQANSKNNEDIDNRVHIRKDPYSNGKYLELIGYLSNGNLCLVQCDFVAVEDSVFISNKFIFIVGTFMLIAGSIVIVIFTNRITRPILRLSEISSRMANLDFDAKFDSYGENEIDILGENINNLSDKLEKTISELKTANNELLRDIEKKNKNEDMRKEFIANVSHELKTPIALIQSYSEGLKEGIIDDEESRNYYLDVIIDESNRMNHLVKDLMSLSEIEFGNKPLEFERFNIVEMIRNKINSSEILFKNQDINVEFEPACECICVWADEYKTEEVLSNYLSNAIHYCSGEEKKIRISLDKKDDIVRINVFNTGSHIDSDSMDRIWDKFYKVDKARSRDYAGSGIGLSIVKAIMDAFNMDYGCDNEEGGVNFYFELPIK